MHMLEKRQSVSTLCYMASPADLPSDVSDLTFPQELQPHVNGELAEPGGAPIELALQLTEAALGQLMRVVVQSIRSGGGASPHVEAAERDLRSALRQLSVVKRNTPL